MDDLSNLLFTAGALALAAGVLIGLHGIRAYSRLTAYLKDSRGSTGQGIVILGLVLRGAAVLVLGGIAVFWIQENSGKARRLQEIRTKALMAYSDQADWNAPDPQTLPEGREEQLIAYGRDLIARTGDYFGAYGLVRPNSVNDLNCQNCHLDAGSKPFGNNYAAVAATYPKVRARSGLPEDISFRVNDCFMRSLDGQPLDTNSREMRAIVAYIRWLGSNVPAKQTPKGSGILRLPYPDRAADPDKGQAVYTAKCASCHGPDGAGLPIPESPRNYPPLWGMKSYSEAAGLFRVSRFAGYVKANMPFGATYQNPQLTDEEAWDVAAFVNSQPRPKHRFLAQDWPDISKKPIDHPFGPYADTFSVQQHKYGPYQPIEDFYKQKNGKVR